MTTKIEDSTQAEVDRAWSLYNNILEELHELEDLIDDLSDEVDFDLSKVQRVVGNAHCEMDDAYSTGASILPPHTSDKED